MKNRNIDAPAKPGKRLHPALARSCARLDEVLKPCQHSRKITDEERAEAIREIYGRMAGDEPRPRARPAPVVAAPEISPYHYLPPALARSATRFAQALANPTDPAHMSVAQRENAIREIYGLPPKHAA